jgi:hypothetical protein
MKMRLILLALTISIHSVANGYCDKNENPFKRLIKDELTGNAVLFYSIKVENSTNRISGSDVCFGRKSMVYSCPTEWYTPKRNEEKLYSGEVTCYYTADPGEVDINLIEVETTNGSYTSSVSFPLSGKFKLEAGVVHYLGVILVDLAKSTCSIYQDESITAMAGSKFKNDFPAIAGALNGKITLANLTRPVPCETMQTLFADDFSQNNASWQISAGNLQKIMIAEGVLTMDNQSTDSSVITKTIDIPGSFDAQAECTWQGGETNKGYGLIIGNDPVTCLKFTITSDGYYSIFRWLPKKDLQWISQNVFGWTKSDAIRTKPGDKNVLRVQKTEWFMHNVGMIAFYVNETLVARNVFYIYPPAGGSGTQFKKQGVIGLFSYGRQVMAWDNFKVSKL